MEDKDFENKLIKADYEASEQENAELKAENEQLKEKILKFRWDNPYFDLYNNVVSQRDMWEQKSKQYKSCLQEIKKLAEVGQDKYHNGLILAKPILDLITKAEEE